MSYTRVDGVCPCCGKDTTMEVDTNDYSQFLQGKPLDECFPYLSVQERNQLGIGLCPDCYEYMCYAFDKAAKRAKHAREPKLITQSLITYAVFAVIITVLYLLHILDEGAMQYIIGFGVGAAIEAKRWYDRYEREP